MDQVLLAVRQQQGLGWRFSLHASFVEIYQETVRDLLTTESERDGKPLVHKIVAAAGGRHVVTDVCEKEVASRADLDALIDIACANKAVAKTDMNARSSRSHTVFSLR